jgi:hypothetical protein
MSDMPAETFDLDAVMFGSDVKAGTYDARLTALAGFTADFEGEARNLIRWTFEAVDGDLVVEVDGVTSTNTGKKAKARAWVTGLLGREPAAGERLGSLGLIGRECMIVVGINDDGYPKVEAVLPAKRGGK